MSQGDRQFAGSIPALYDELMVPMIFAPYAEDLAARIAAFAPRRVLETAAGTGVVTRTIIPHLDAEARYVATDLNQPMLDRAARNVPPDPRLSWRQADALHLPFEAASFDTVLCQFGAMFFPDRAAGFREARRVLAPGGRLLFSAWDSLAENDFARVVDEAVVATFPDDPPRFLARLPHGYHNADQIRRDVLAGGFARVEIASVSAISQASDALTAATAFCQGTPLRNEIEPRSPDALERLTRAATARLAERYGAGALGGRMRAFVCTATG